LVERQPSKLNVASSNLVSRSLSTSIDLPGMAALANASERRGAAPRQNLGAPPRLEELRARREEILAIAKRNGASNLRVFGSVARGDAKPSSDLDLLLNLEPGRSLLDMAGLVADLEDLLGCAVDVTREAAIRRAALRERILAEAAPL
jgi:uncharacterized protein